MKVFFLFFIILVLSLTMMCDNLVNEGIDRANETRQSVGFGSATNSTDEGDTGTASYDIAVNLAKISDSDITVDYAITAGTATAGTDYSGTDGTLTIPAGEVSANISILLTGDYFVEGDEDFTITLSNQSDGSLGVSTQTFTITDDDVMPASPRLYYPFNGNADDESGYGYDGTLVGGTALTTDRYGNADSAYVFDGTDDYIQITNASGGALYGTEGSFSVWIYNTSTSAGFIYNDWVAASNNRLFEMDVNPTGTGQIVSNRAQACDSATVYAMTSTSAYQLDKWVYICSTWKVGETTKIYVNGVLATESASALTAVCSSASPNGIQIGGVPGFDFFEGKIDDIRLYNSVLSVKEMNVLYHENGYAGD